MGYEDPEPQFAALAELVSRMQGSIKDFYDYVPERFRDYFLSSVMEEVKRLRELASALENYGQAGRAVASGYRPNLPKSELLMDWYPVRGMPVWTVWHRPDERQDVKFADYTPAPERADIAIYLDEYDDKQLEAVESASFELADSLGYGDFKGVIEEHGSIFRVWRGRLKSGLSSDFVQQKMQELDQRVSIELVGKARAETDAITTTNAVNLIASLADIPNAVARVGGILIIKQTDQTGNPSALIRELNTREIRAFQQNPGLQKSPDRVLELLALAVHQLDDEDGNGPAAINA